jgi:glycosyltransferase involved in cell wall biosynthesis
MMNPLISEERDYFVSVIIPAYEEAGVIASVVQRVHDVLHEMGVNSEIIVIDDGSEDGTAEEASCAGAEVISHPYNLGNGAAVKTGIRSAQGKVILLMDGDGQHDPGAIPDLIEALEGYDMVVGARSRHSETKLYRDLANHIYNLFASYVSGRRIEDLTSGFRAIKTEIARKFVYLLPNTFSYPTTITLATIRSGHSLKYVPIKTNHRVGKSKIKLFRDGVRFLMIIIKIATFFSPLKVFLPVALMMFMVGFGYGLFKVIFLGQRYGPTSAMLMTISVLVFLIGLVSEQIAQMRFDRAEILNGQPVHPTNRNPILDELDPKDAGKWGR